MRVIRTISAHTVASILLMCVALAPARAQTATDDASCLGFAFGTWTPPLNWKGAGHVNPLDSAHVGRAPGGRGWAANDTAGATPYLMLFPMWWPAGVALELPNRSPAIGDTVTGKATALIADGRLRAPVASVRAWRVACASSPTSAASSATPPATPTDSMIGTWKGSSICVNNRAGCKNESVVYHVSHRAGMAAGALAIDANKIVAGNEEPMGLLTCDRDSSSIVACTIPLGTWRFMTHGSTLEGAFTANDGTQIRSVHARKLR